MKCFIVFLVAGFLLMSEDYIGPTGNKTEAAICVKISPG